MIRARPSLTGTATVTRFIMRRDRVRIAVWIGAIVLLVVLMVASVKGLYPTHADLDQAALAAKGNAAAIAFNGPAQALDTVGGEVAFQMGATGMVLVALMSLLMIGSLTRGEEEAGRLELVRSLPVGRHAPTAAAFITVAAMDVFIGALAALALIGQHLPAAGSLSLGASLTLLGLFFAAVTLVAAQVSENTRVVSGIAGALLGLSFVVRAVGDVGDGAVSWFSPIGWAQKARPFAGELWWPFLPLVAAIVGLVALTGVLASRRDVGAGLVQPRPGPAVAASSLGRPLGLAVRLQRGSLIGWSVGLLVGGLAYGSIANSINDFVRDNKALSDLLAPPGGGSLTDSYFAASFGLLALAASGFVIQSALRLRVEETSLRAEPLLATPLSRRRWAMSHLTVAFAGSVVVLAVAGLSTACGYVLGGGGLGQLPRLLGAAVVYAPALWLLVGLTVAIVGLAPRGTIAAWAALVFCFVVGFLGTILGVPRWLASISPFDHTPQLPAAGLAVGPLLALVAIAAGLTGIGLYGLRRRDIG